MKLRDESPSESGLNMLQRDIIASAERHRNYIKAKVGVRLTRTMQINRGCITNLLDFAGIHRFRRRAESRSLLAAASDFYDHENVSLPGNDVEFSAAAAPIPLKNRVSL